MMFWRRMRMRWVVVIAGLPLAAGYGLLLYRLNVMPHPDGALAKEMLRAVRSDDPNELRQFIAKHGADAEARFHYASTSDTRSALRLAAELCRCTSIKAVLDSGVDPHGRSSLKQNALHLAVKSNCPCGVELLVRAGLDPFQGSEDGRAPAQAAFYARKARSLRAMAKATDDPRTRAQLEELMAQLR